MVAVYKPDTFVAKVDGKWTTVLRPAAGHRMHSDLAILLSTSGSAGSPKLVRLSHAAVEANSRSIAEFLGIGPEQRPITTLPIGYSYGLSVLTSHLSQGARVLLTDRSVTDQAFWRFLDQEAATSLAGVPYTYELLDTLGFTERAHPSLQILTPAGGCLPKDTATRYARWSQAHGVRFFVMYGQTEATARIAYVPPELLARNPDAIGLAIPGGELRLLDENGDPITTPGMSGELSYRGPNVMMGYAYGRGDLAKGREHAELLTGDMATIDAEGLYRIVGRKSRFSKIYGKRIGLDDIESILSKDGLRGYVAGDDALIAVAVTGSLDVGLLAKRLAHRLGVPISAVDVASVEGPPLLSSGKIDYRSLLSDAYRRRAEASTRAPASGITVQGAFAKALPRAIVRPEDTFVSLGGDSLSYVSLTLDLETQLGVLPRQWAEMSVAELQQLADKAVPPKPGAWRLREIETEVAVRAAAIAAVVTNHASNLPISGGADLLLLLLGYNLARYQRLRLISDDRWQVLTSFLKRIVLPYYSIVIAYMVVKQSVDIPSLLLISNFTGRYGTFLEPFWFVEATTQITLVVVALFTVPALRRLADKNPWRCGLFLLVATMALKVAVFGLLRHEVLDNRTPDAIGYLVALGWCVQRADTLSRKVFVSALCAAVALLELSGIPRAWMAFSYPINLTHAASLAVASGLILWLPRLRVPDWLRAGVGAVAGASLYIYLTHGVSVHILLYDLKVTNLATNLVVAFAVGLAAMRLSQSGNMWIAKFIRREKPSTFGVSPDPDAPLADATVRAPDQRGGIAELQIALRDDAAAAAS